MDEKEQKMNCVSMWRIRRCGSRVFEYSSHIGEEGAKKIGDEMELRPFDAKDKECCFPRDKTSKRECVSSEVGRIAPTNSHFAYPRWYPCTKDYL